MSAAANKRLIEQIYSDAASRSGTTFIDNLADDVTWVVTGQYSWSGTYTGKEAITNDLLGHLRTLLTARARTVAFNVIAEGDYVVVEAKGDNQTKSGDRYDNEYCIVWRVEDGKIKQIREYCDSALIERVLGPFPKSPA
jgi:uncharacterized protein